MKRPDENRGLSSRSRSVIIRAGVVVVLLAASIAVVRGLETVMNATFDKPPAHLRMQFVEMPSKISGAFSYAASGPDEVMSVEVIETLGTTEYLVRNYSEATGDPTKLGSQVSLNLNFYPTGSSTPHVPENCWAANGLNEAPNSRQLFDVKDVKHADGTVSDLKMRLITFMPPKGQPDRSESGEPLYVSVAYVFNVNGQYVPSPREVMSHFWTASNKYAYHCKIEVTPMNPVDHKVLSCTPTEAKEIVSKFMREALPSIEACLPDPAILTKGETVIAGNE